MAFSRDVEAGVPQNARHVFESVIGNGHHLHDVAQSVPKVRQPDIGRAKKVLGWEPKVDFEEGITKTIDYFREYLKSNA